MVVDNHQVVHLKKSLNYKKIENGLNILDKEVVNEKNYCLIKASHDGYLKRFGIIHQRSVELLVAEKKLFGKDKLIKKRSIFKKI